MTQFWILALLGFFLPLKAQETNPTIEELIRLSKEKAEQQKQEITQQLAEVTPFLYLPYEENTEIVEERLHQLLQLGPPVVPYLLPLLEPSAGDDRKIQLARNCARVVGQFKTEEVLQFCQQLLEKGSIEAKKNAIAVLAAFNDAISINSLFPLLRADQPTELRFAAIRALIQTKNPYASVALAQTMQDVDLQSASEILTTLEEALSPEAIPLVANCLNIPYLNSLASRIMDFLAKHKDRAVLPILLQSFHNPQFSRFQNIKLMRTLAVLGHPSYSQGAEVLRTWLANSDPELSNEAAYALFELGDDSGIKQLLTPYHRFIKDRSRDPSGYEARGRVYLRLKKYRDALADFKDAIRLTSDPGANAELTVFKAVCLAGLGQFKEAHSALKASKYSPAQLAAYHQYEEFANLRKHPKYGQVFKD